MLTESPGTKVFGRTRSSSFLFLFLLTLLCLQAVGQTESPQAKEATREPIPLMASEVASESEETTAFLNAATLRSQPRTTLITIENQLPRAEESTRRIIATVDDELEAHLSLTELGDLRNSLQRKDNLLRSLRDQIQAESERLEESLLEIRTRSEFWRLTEEAGVENDYPAAVMQLIQQTLEALDGGRQKISDRRSHLLSLQNAVVASRAQVHEKVIQVTAAEEAHRSRLFSFRGPPFWDLTEIEASGVWQRFSDQFNRNAASFSEYATEKKNAIFASFIFLVVATLLLRATRKKLGEDLSAYGDLRGARLVLEHPFSSSLALVLFLNTVLHPEAPHSWFKVILLIALVPLLRLLPALVPGPFRTFVYLLLGLRTLELINSQVPEVTPLGRLLSVLIIVLSIVSLAWFSARIRSAQTVGPKWRALLYSASWVGLCLTGVALLCGLLGNLTLAGLLAGGTIKTAFQAGSYWLVLSVFEGMLALALRSETAGRSALIRANRELIIQKAVRIARALTVLLFVLTVPHFFSLFDPIAAVVAGLLTTPLKLRSFSLSLADIFAFVFVVWLSFQASRLVCFVLEEDTLPRFTLPRGVPEAISRLTYYAILFVGFVIALTAAGFDLSNITILFSAFGVGIGFGLQNIVNNFVSGLILLFERPVHVGDKIQLAQDLTGEVVRIGIRASVVRTFEGAEVLVPNGQLISNELTNWTLSDPRRRIAIPVGVAYGTDPEKVLGILKSLAEAHPRVLREPPPSVLFMGFGESALDFSLRVWVASFEASFEVRSELSVAVNNAFQEAGIEIPFPQRDLHLRSVTGDIQIADRKQGRRKT